MEKTFKICINIYETLVDNTQTFHLINRFYYNFIRKTHIRLFFSERISFYYTGGKEYSSFLST